MKIIKHGKVIFEDGQIVGIEGWHVEGMTPRDLEEYVRAHYVVVN